MIADPLAKTYLAFGIRHSRWGKLKAMMTRLPALIFGMKEVGLRGVSTGNIMPADILIDENGQIIETYYGQDAGDHIPMERIELFSVKGLASRG